MGDDLNLHKKWFAGVDSLRFILALIVLLSHFNNPYITPLLNSPNQLIRLSGYFLANAFDGTAAVVAFFIISGFVIHYPNKNGIKNLKNFWIRRFTRVFVPLIVISVIGIWFNHPEKAVVWSLICELAYYAVYPLLLKINISWRYQFLLSYFVAIVIISIGSRHDITSLLNQTPIRYHGYYWQLGIFITWLIGLPVWLLGVLIAEHIHDFPEVKLSKVVFYRIIVFTLSCFFTIAKVYLYVSYIVSMNIFAIIIYRWIQVEIIYFKNRQPYAWLEKLGKFSYSLYLCHPLIYLILGFWINNNVFSYPIVVIATIFTSYLFYKTVEYPAHHLALKLSKKYI